MDISTFLGRLHPLVVHLPIGFLLLAGVFLLLSKWEKFAVLQKALPISFLLSGLSAGAAALFGLLLAKSGSYDEDILFWHKWLGIGVAVSAFIAYLWSVGWKKSPLWLGMIAIGLVSAAGHLGGALTHGEDYLLEPLKGEVKTAAFTLPEQRDSIVVYAHLVQPVLEKKCYACHNDSKQNGGLNMSTWEGLQKGGHSGKIMDHHALKSELFKRLSLPQNNKKFMPPKGEPLTFAELHVLKWWLDNGAKPHAKFSAMDLNPEVEETLLHYYGIDTRPKSFVERVNIDALSQNLLTELEQQGWQVNALAQTNHLLEITPVKPSEVTGAKLEVLLKAKEHITWLNLGTCNLEDKDLNLLGQFTNLNRLRLEKNRITDSGLTHLVGLKNLESLNLYGNPVSDKGLIQLESLPALKKIYLWQTAVTDAGKTKFQSTRSDVEFL